jgi:hypothetical protein
MARYHVDTTRADIERWHREIGMRSRRVNVERPGWSATANAKRDELRSKKLNTYNTNLREV